MEFLPGYIHVYWHNATCIYLTKRQAVWQVMGDSVMYLISQCTKECLQYCGHKCYKSCVVNGYDITYLYIISVFATEMIHVFPISPKSLFSQFLFPVDK